MKALVMNEVKQPLILQDLTNPKACIGQVIVKLKAAALSLADLTAYRALFKQCKLQSLQTIVITGIGGGVACIALQLATAAGATTIVTSSSQAKLDKALAMGATAGFLYTTEGYASQINKRFGSVHLVVDGAGGDGYSELVEMTCPGGIIVNYGITTGPSAKLELRKVYRKQLHLIGTIMGSPDDFATML